MSQFIQIMVVVGAVTGVLLAILRPHWAVVLIVAMFPMEQLLQNYVAPLRSYTPMYNIFVALVTGLAVVLRIGKKDRVMSGFVNPASVGIAAFYLLWTAGLLYTQAPEYALKVFNQSVPYMILLLVIFPLLVKDLEELNKVFKAVLFSGGLVSVLIVADPSSQFVGGRLLVDTGTYGRFGNPLALGELGGITAVIAALLRPNKPSQLFTLIRIGAFLAGFSMSIGSGSRGQVLAAVAAGVLFFPMSRKLSNPKQFFINMFGLAILVLGIYVVFQLFIGYDNQARWDTDLMRRDIEGRWLMAMELLNNFIDSPASWLFGLGPSAYYALTGDAYVHNVPVEILCEHGIVGALIFAFITYSTFRAGKGLWEMFSHDPIMRATVAVLFAICLNQFILVLKQGSVANPAPFFWWAIISKMYYHHRKLAADAEEEWVDSEAETENSEEAADEYGGDPKRDYALGY